MPLKLNVGVSRKVGLPNYGSVGASCNLELELDATLLERDLDAFHNQIRGAYVAAHQAVHDELARLQTLTDGKPQAPAWTSERGNSRNGYDGENRNGHSRGFQACPRAAANPPRRTRSRRSWRSHESKTPISVRCCGKSTGSSSLRI